MQLHCLRLLPSCLVTEVATGYQLPASNILEKGASSKSGAVHWLSQAMMAELFQTSPQNITLHFKSPYSEGEIVPEATCKSYLQVRSEGGGRFGASSSFTT
jgi:hypothetical protein